MIKRFNDFLKENKNENDLINDLIILLRNLEDYDGSLRISSYSHLIGKKDEKWDEVKPILDQIILTELNLKFEEVVKLFNPSNTLPGITLLSIDYWSHFVDSLDQENAYIDRYLYDIWENLKDNHKYFKPVLGGPGYGEDWVDPQFSFDDTTEFEYKYEYGSHLTEYGQKLIASQNIELTDFIHTWFEKYFDWNKFNQMIKSRCLSDVDINHWNNEYLIIENDLIIFNYQDYIDDNKKDINKTVLINSVLNFLCLDNYQDNGEVLIIKMTPKNIYHQSKGEKLK